MNDTKDFRDIILSDRKKTKPQNIKGSRIGNIIDYMQKVQKNPEIASFAPGRIYNMIMKHGTVPVPDEEKITGYEDLVRYKFFDGEYDGTMFGTFEPIHDLMKFLKASAKRTETGKRILIMVGPVASGKSTIATLLKKGLENDDTPIFSIEGCPLHEEPLHLIPMENRKYWEDKLGVKIEGHLCPVCQQKLDMEFTEKDGSVRWEDMPIVEISLSEQRRAGIATFQPSDHKSQDISELIGRPNLAKIARYGETDPRGFQFNGELQVGNRGVIEYIEILKADIKFHYTLIPVAQEQLLKSPGFPQTFIDTVILSHTNTTEFDSFASERKNEAIQDRMFKVHVGWNLKVDDEVKIYKKIIADSDYNKIHIAPYTLRLMAQFAILTRLKPDPQVSSLIEKMKLYNGEVTSDFKTSEIDIKQLKERGRANGEGMTGISPRFSMNVLNIALAKKEDKTCINPIDILRGIRENFDHSIGIKPEDVDDYLKLLRNDQNSVFTEFKEFAKKEVKMSFLTAFSDQAEELFTRYMINVKAYNMKERIKDEATGEYSNPDERLMRSLEEIINIPENAKDEFRNGIFVHKASCLENGRKFTYKDYMPLEKAIEQKLMSDLRNVVNLSLTATSSTKKQKARVGSALKNLIKNKGYCKHCGDTLIKFVSELMRKTT